LRFESAKRLQFKDSRGENIEEDPDEEEWIDEQRGFPLHKASRGENIEKDPGEEWMDEERGVPSHKTLRGENTEEDPGEEWMDEERGVPSPSDRDRDTGYQTIQPLKVDTSQVSQCSCLIIVYVWFLSFFIFALTLKVFTSRWAANVMIRLWCK
jgi:hypothetical protein